MPSTDDEVKSAIVEINIDLLNASRGPSKAPSPTILQQSPTANIHHFPVQLDSSLSSSNNTASRRRGRFVIKLAATLFLAMQDDFVTPEKCAEAMNSLWSHTRLAQEYLRRKNSYNTSSSSYTRQQLTKAEGQWKTALGNQVLEPNGFQRCWYELVPFFRNTLEEIRCGKHHPSVSPDPKFNAEAVPPVVRGFSIGKSERSLISHVPVTMPGVTRTTSPSSEQAEPLFRGSAKPAASLFSPSLDLARVRVSGLSSLFNNTVLFLRHASAPRRAASINIAATSNVATEEEQAFLASRGWLPVRHVLECVYTELKQDSALKALWAWLLSLPEDQNVILYLSLLLPLNITGEMQFLHVLDSNNNNHTGTTAALSNLASVTHMRATQGHYDKDVAVAVLREHPQVPLRSLVANAPNGSATVSGWFEYVRDMKVLRKSLQDVGGAVYTPELPCQVLLSCEALADVCAPLRPASLQCAASAAAAPLADLMRRTNTSGNIPGDVASSAFDAVDTAATSVNARELTALLQHTSSFHVAAAVAAVTVVAPRLGFVKISPVYLTRQDAAVCGLAVHAHMVRTDHLPPHHRCDANSDVVMRSCDGDDERSRAGSTFRLSAVAAETLPRCIFVLPHTLTFGLLQLPSATAAVEPSSSSSSPLPRECHFPAAACAVDGRAAYGIVTNAARGGLWVTVRQPPTELLIDLRIASLWDLWMWYGFTRSPPPSPTSSSLTDKMPAKPKKKAVSSDTRRHCQLVVEKLVGVMSKLPLPLLLPPSPPPLTTFVSDAEKKRSDEMNGTTQSGSNEKDVNNGDARTSASVANAASNANGVDSAEESLDAIPHLPWEFFPGAQAEALVLRLDAIYKADLVAALEAWRDTGLLLLKPPTSYDARGPPRTGTRGGDMLRSLASGATSSAGIVADVVPQWKIRERALWEGLGRWINAVQTACDMPAFSLLLPPNIRLYPPPPQSTSVAAPTRLKERGLGVIGRKKGLASLRRLFGGPDAPTIFFIEEEHTYVPQGDLATNSLWVLEDTEAAQSDNDDGGAGGSVSCADALRWTVTSHPEVLLAELQESSGDKMIAMYLQQACVLHRTTDPRGRKAMTAAAAGTGTRALRTTTISTSSYNNEECFALREDRTDDGQNYAVRLLRFVGHHSGGTATSVKETSNLSEVENKAPPGCSNSATAASCETVPVVPGSVEIGGIVEEIPLHAPLRHAHCGCRVSPLVCDELVLGAAWPAEAIVDYALFLPLREALEVYAAKVRATYEAPLHRRTRKSCDAPSTTTTTTQETLEILASDLRRELLSVLTDEAAMEQREFYGDGLLDYCTAVAVLSYRHAATNVAIWRGGSITESSTNNALVVQALPRLLRDYWMSRRRICNGKRLADCVESLFGALSMALWVLPLRRRQRALDAALKEESAGTLCPPLHEITSSGADLLAPDADMLIYVASALLQLLSGGN